VATVTSLNIQKTAIIYTAISGTSVLCGVFVSVLLVSRVRFIPKDTLSSVENINWFSLFYELGLAEVPLKVY